MPIKLPNLDDRTFADLVAEAKALIPVHAPEWTNHNESDPGITLIELFAYLTEMQIYRLNRVTDANVCAFLKLIDRSERTPSEQNRGMVSVPNRGEVALRDQVRDVVLNLRQQDRAVTCEDFERLALAASPGSVERAYCVPQRDLSRNPKSNNRYEKAEGHVSIVILPSRNDFIKKVGQDDLIRKINQYLDPRRLLTTRVHVVAPLFLTVGVHARLNLKPDAKEEDVLRKAEEALDGFFSPDKPGWPFGRPVYVSEIYTLLNSIPGVDFVTKAKAIDEKTKKPFEILTAYDGDADAALDISDKRRVTFSEGKAVGELVALKLQPDELVNFSMKKSHLEYEHTARKDEAATSK